MSLKNVLVVDDEEDLTWSIAKHLSKDKEHYNLHAVNSAADALALLKTISVELVISDIRMPEISGLDLLLKIRELYPSTKVIIMTAYGSSEIQEEANRRGCFKYIEKPFEINKLRQMILDTVKEKKGFEGRISDFQLSDLIQMNCLGRLTNAITVETMEKKGIIYFEDGNIIHSTVGDLDGEEAFYEIICWQGGSFAINKGAKADQETIMKGWQSLMLEGLRRNDEKRETEEVLDSDEIKKQQVDEIFSKFIETKGVHLLILFDKTGKPFVTKLNKQFEEKYDVDNIKEQIENLIKQEKKLSSLLNLSTKKEITIEYDEGLLKITWLAEAQDFLLLLADHTSNFGLLRIETKKYLKALNTSIN
ncbi:MAG: response regulator [Calditrichaeota bacterium]|nr:MAG: response regulator [Calditrichota bacterium]MBL1203949.1 response regulator [Calditrichota bacterium]NOG43780.1 response regulator [Calditrichota bacterium]